MVQTFVGRLRYLVGNRMCSTSKVQGQSEKEMTTYTYPFEANMAIWSGHKPRGFTKLSQDAAIDDVARIVGTPLDDRLAVATAECTPTGCVLSVETAQPRGDVERAVARAFEELGMLARF